MKKRRDLKADKSREPMYIRHINQQFVSMKGFMPCSNEKKCQFSESNKMGYIKGVWKKDEALWVLLQEESTIRPSLQLWEPVQHV